MGRKRIKKKALHGSHKSHNIFFFLNLFYGFDARVTDFPQYRKEKKKEGQKKKE